MGGILVQHLTGLSEEVPELPGLLDLVRHYDLTDRAVSSC